MGNCESDSITHDPQIPVLGRLGAVTDLKMVNCIWEKDYQGLFDYESKQIRKHLYVIKENSIVFNGKEFKKIKETEHAELQEGMLEQAAFQVIRKQNYYKILPIYIENQQYTLQKLLWLVVRTVPGHKYPLKEKDIVKFGKQKIRVREIVFAESNQSAIIDFNAIKTSKKVYEDLQRREVVEPTNPPGKEEPANEVVSIATENEQTCRICLQAGEFSNPLICPCKCTGSVRYIHLQCLRTWLGKQLHLVKNKNCISIKWTPLTCQMCKTHYKYCIYLDNKKFYTVEIPKPEKPYIVLQVMKKSAEYSKILHFVTFHQTSQVSVGRKKDIDIKISDDISISRHHANITYDFENKTFLLEDNKSKFGTLVLIKRNLLINPFQRGISFQLGGELYAFQTHRGEGSIPDYHDEEEYLNVVNRGQTESQEQESEENNEEEDFEEDVEQELNVSTNANLPLEHAFNNSRNQSNIMSNNNSSTNPMRRATSLVVNMERERQEQVQVPLENEELHQ